VIVFASIVNLLDCSNLIQYAWGGEMRVIYKYCRNYFERTSSCVNFQLFICKNTAELRISPGFFSLLSKFLVKMRLF